MIRRNYIYLFLAIASNSLLQARSIEKEPEVIDLGIQMINNDHDLLKKSSRRVPRETVDEYYLEELNDVILELVVEDILDEVEAELIEEVDALSSSQDEDGDYDSDDFDDRNELDGKLEALTAILALETAQKASSNFSIKKQKQNRQARASGYRRARRSRSFNPIERDDVRSSSSKQRSTNQKRNLASLSTKMNSRIEFLKKLRKRRSGKYSSY